MLYKTLELGEKSSDTDNSHKPLSIILTNLKPYTEYLITVQPFNSIGLGPASNPISIRTLEDGKFEIY